MMHSTEVTHSRSNARWIIAVPIAVIGAVILFRGFYLETRNPRTNAEDNFAWFVLALGTSMTAAGVAIPFARRWVVVLIAFVSPFLAFSLAVVAFWITMLSNRWPSQQQMVTAGYPMIPQAKQIDHLFGPAWHQTSNYQEPNVVEWITTALFAGRYELTMRVHVEVDRLGNVSKVIGEPRFMLGEVARVEGREVSYGQWHEFGAEEWEKVVKAKDDFSVIGIRLDRDNPVHGFVEYKKMVRNGIQMKAGTRLPDGD